MIPLLNLLVVAVAMVMLWLWSLRTRNVSIVDIFWGIGFVLISWVTVLANETTVARGWVMATAVTLWGVRLAVHLAWRNAGKGEDYRYAAMRQRQGARFAWWSLLWVFGLQGLLMWIVSWPIQFGARSPAPWNWWDGAGLVLWTVGWLCETVGDWQLARFKSKPEHAGRVMDRGLWRYTRHPNYFGDFLVWWGVYLMALASGDAWWTAISPVVMSVLLMRVSGVTLLEQGLRERRPEYEAYMRRTSVFFPWWPGEK